VSRRGIGIPYRSLRDYQSEGEGACLRYLEGARKYSKNELKNGKKKGKGGDRIEIGLTLGYRKGKIDEGGRRKITVFLWAAGTKKNARSGER